MKFEGANGSMSIVVPEILNRNYILSLPRFIVIKYTTFPRRLYYAVVLPEMNEGAFNSTVLMEALKDYTSINQGLGWGVVYSTTIEFESKDFVWERKSHEANSDKLYSNDGKHMRIKEILNVRSQENPNFSAFIEQGEDHRGSVLLMQQKKYEDMVTTESKLTLQFKITADTFWALDKFFKEIEDKEAEE